MSVIKVSNNTVIATITVGSYPQDVAFSPDETRAFVGHGIGTTVSMIDVATNTVDAITPTITVGSVPHVVTFSPDGKYAAVANLNGDTVSLITVNTIGSALPPAGTTSYSFTVPAPNGTAFSVTSGSLPLGLSLAPATGAITGTPTTAGSSAFTVTVTGGDTGSASRSYTIAVTALLAATGVSGSPILVAGGVGTILFGGVLLLFATWRRRMRLAKH